jgi:hypothetical protein
MNKFVLSALACTTASSLAFAGSETEEWLTLDREIENLATSLAQGGSGLSVDGFIKTSYINSSDVQLGTQDLSGFSIDNARVNLTGNVGDYMLFVSIEGSGDPAVAPNNSGPIGSLGGGHFGTFGTTGGPGVLDAYVATNWTENFGGQFGAFRPPFLTDGLRDEDELLFIDRTVQGNAWSFRDVGAMLFANFDMLGVWGALQNGADSAGEDFAYTLRVAFNALGSGFGGPEGAASAAGDDGSNLSIAAAYYEDNFLTNGGAFEVDAQFAMGIFYAAATVVDYDTGIAFTGPGAIIVAGQTPWDVTAAVEIVPDTWEAAARFEDFDDSNNSQMYTLGVNFYQAGHDAKVQLNWSGITSDLAALEISALQIALLVSV